jgi:O-antigen/teichoic acid export membrane protein
MTVGGVSRRAFWVLVSTFATLVIGYAASLITARLLGPDDRGLLAVLQTDAIVATVVLALGVQYAILYYASGRPTERPALLGLALVQTVAVAAVAFGIVLLAGPAIAGAQGGSYDAQAWLLAAGLVPLGYLEFSLLHLVQARLNFWLPNVMSIVARVVVLVTTIVLVAELGLGVTGAVIALLAFEVVQIAAYLPTAARDGIRFSKQIAREALSYGVRVQLGSLFRIAAGRFDLMLLSLFAAHATVAYYAIAQIVSELVLLAPRAIGTVLLPVVASGPPSESLSDSSLRLNGTLSLLSVGGVAVFGPLLITFGYGSAFNPAIVPCLILLPGIWFLSAGNLVSFVLSARGRPGTGSLIAALQGILTVGLDLLLIPPFGAVGAAIASSVAYMLYGIVSLAAVARQSGTRTRALFVMSPSEVRTSAGQLRAHLTSRFAGPRGS